MRANAGLVALALSMAASFSVPSAGHTPDPALPRLMTPRDVLALPVNKPDHIISYGMEASQFGELRLPTGKGPFPVVVLIHGGCFMNKASTSFMGAMADALKHDGIATWNIEYRRLPEAGSGWPGTYRDVGDAIDFLRKLAPRYRLDLSRVIVVGHSAGGHLAHWAAARARLRPESPLFITDPLRLNGIINLAGRVDMATGVDAYEQLCHGPVIRSLLGGLPSAVPERYADASPANLLPLRVPQILIWGEFEDFVPTGQVEDYVRRAKLAGDDVRLLKVPNAGHFESASPASVAWKSVHAAIRSLIEE